METEYLVFMNMLKHSSPTGKWFNYKHVLKFELSVRAFGK